MILHSCPVQGPRSASLAWAFYQIMDFVCLFVFEMGNIYIIIMKSVGESKTFLPRNTAYICLTWLTIYRRVLFPGSLDFRGAKIWFIIKLQAQGKPVNNCCILLYSNTYHLRGKTTTTKNKKRFSSPALKTISENYKKNYLHATIDYRLFHHCVI